jgi:hypothetical protein
MKTSSFLPLAITALAVKLSLLSADAAPGTNTTASSNIVQKSVFTVPANKNDGCDPFFPSSTRLWSMNITAGASPAKSKPTGLECLVLKGLSGAAGNPLAIINGHTMARGENTEIATECGRLLVHCVDITANSAIVEVAGERRELRLRSDL